MGDITGLPSLESSGISWIGSCRANRKKILGYYLGMLGIHILPKVRKISVVFGWYRFRGRVPKGWEIIYLINVTQFFLVFKQYVLSWKSFRGRELRKQYYFSIFPNLWRTLPDFLNFWLIEWITFKNNLSSNRRGKGRDGTVASTALYISCCKSFLSIFWNLILRFVKNYNIVCLF